MCINLLKFPILYAKTVRTERFMKNPFVFEEPEDKDVFILKEDTTPTGNNDKPFKISRNIKDNEEYLKKRFSIPENNDVVLRKFQLKGNRDAFVIFYDGMSNGTFISSNVIETMQYIPELCDEDIKLKKEEILYKFISNSQAQPQKDIEKIIDEVNFGSCGVFVDGIDIGFSIDVRFWEHRTVQKPQNEQSVFGPQEAFNEMLRSSSALIRKTLKTEKLICKGVQVGKVSKTRGVLMYIDDVANKNLVDEVSRRINGIKTDYVFAIEEVGNFIKDAKFSVTNQILTTERPDRAARYLADGRVALILSGSPSALIFPTNAFELLHSPSDSYMNTIFVNAARVIRLVAALISVLLPGAYLALTLFHQEMIPTYLLYSISASRENVPFPSVLELLLMDFSFEMIREAGLRMPGVLGSTLGIVGGLILGQAAVSAKIVSPIMIIIIAITGIGSFATGNYSLGWSYRILRFAFIILGASFGFFGISTGVFIYSVYIGTLKSFGIDFLTPSGDGRLKRALFAKNIWSDEYRPGFLKARKKKKEEKISRSWLFK